LMSCRLLWQPVAVFAYYVCFIVFCSKHGDK